MTLKNKLCSERISTTVILCCTGSRDLSGRDALSDDLDSCGDRDSSEDKGDDEFIAKQRRIRERAAAAFDEDIAELRRKRQDLQDRMFDVINLNAEIEKAKSTLGAADNAFQRHALRFDNTEEQLTEENSSLAQRLDRARKAANEEAQLLAAQQQLPNNVKLMKLVPVGPNEYAGDGHVPFPVRDVLSPAADPQLNGKVKPNINRKPKADGQGASGEDNNNKPRKSRRGYSKRRKDVSF